VHHTTVADSYVTAASQSAGSVAQQAADRKCQQYGELFAAYEFQPVPVETHGSMDDATVWFFSDLGRKISERSGDPLGHFYSAPQCSHCKHCTSYGIFVRLSVCHTAVLCQNDGT